MSTQPDNRNAAWGAPVRHENLWPVRAAVLATIVLYITLDDRLTVGPTWLPPALEMILLATLTVMAPIRHRTQTMLQRVLALCMIALINCANLSSLALLLYALLHKGVVMGGKPIDGPLLLQAALQVWLTNILVFSLWYWELDRGGPVQRRMRHHRQPDFLFPQMSTPACSIGNWTPHFIDYLFLSFTNATAFSPTDTLPLTPWAKILMMVQSLASLVTVALVAARAVNILN